MLHTLLENSTIPIITAFILGLMTIISPCPFCTNITAIGFISKDIKSKHLVLLNGFMYALGKVVAYSGLSLIFIFGANILNVQQFFEKYGEPAIGPFLIVCGIFMLGIFNLHKHKHEHKSEKITLRERIVSKSKTGNSWWAFILGIVFSLAFCPYTAVLYFGMLIPLSLAEHLGFLLPISFGIATGLPVVIIAFIIAYSVGSIAKISQQMQKTELWLRRVCALLFIAVGIYWSVSLFSGQHNCEEHGHTHTTECNHSH